ncbi:hypothetical protein B0A55_02678 [Friedmanniomyces simplex]|uniref:2-hydroxyacyl-CoA lyase n=1 Tax=Friedmanniomyces simplex TaxID=329884 RepID=A0A4U0XQF3_9PEZI|nr:hypothetical protein B0A55_02678 [Friedmanniomyces simplex]
MVYGARIIAQALQDLGVTVIFGTPGLPCTDIAQEGLYLGIRFISFRNEQAAAYAATAYGYLTGKPGIPHAAANSWPLLVLSGSSETHNSGKAAFQEVDAISLLTPHTKLAVRPPSADLIPKFINDAFRAAMFGRPGPAFVDLPANLILGHFDVERQKLWPYTEIPRSVAPRNKIQDIVQAFKTAKAPLVVFGKGAAYGRAEAQIRTLIERTGLPFVPTPMGKGIVPDSSPHNYSAARSSAFKHADVVLVLGAKLNWILSFGLPPKWSPDVKIIQVDINADELGKNGGHPTLSVVGDVGLVVDELISAFGDWRWQGPSSAFYRILEAAASKNKEKAAKKATVDKLPMTFEKAYDVIKGQLDRLSDPAAGGVVYVSEGANAMDIGRSIFTMEHPRIRLDAGSYATMGVGMGYAIASYAAYNFPQPEGQAGKPGRKKIVAIEGDSAFGFSAIEVETMARYQMDVIVFVMNNSGVYRGDADSAEKWQERQRNTVAGTTTDGKGLSAWSLGYQTEYQKIAEMAGGIGMVVRTPDELEEATEKAYHARVPVVINVIIDPQADLPM